MADGLGTRATEAVFDEAAATYDSDFAGTTAGVWLRESVWSRLTPFIKPGMHVLDLGCGTGEDALWLARNACRVTAADGSPAMLERVAAKAARGESCASHTNDGLGPQRARGVRAAGRSSLRSRALELRRHQLRR